MTSPDSTTALRRLALAYAIVALVFLPIDALWLTTMAGRLYQPALGHLMAAEPRPLAIVLFYALYLGGVVAFGVRPGLAAEPLRGALKRGWFFGLVAYGTYDLTNQATLDRWPWFLTGIDLVWGSCLTALACMSARWVLLLAKSKQRV